MSTIEKWTHQFVNLLQGTLDMLILRTLRYGPAHGRQNSACCCFSYNFHRRVTKQLFRPLERRHGHSVAARSGILVLALASVLSVFLSSDLQAQSLSEQIRRAANLNDEGNFSESVKLLTPLLQSQGQRNEPIIGIAWNINGSALQGTGDEEGARRCYERAIEILRKTPTEKPYLAAALDNLGSSKAEMGQLAESQSLRKSARAWYQSVGDHAGVARTSINLAIVALAQRKRKEMPSFLSDAFSAEAQVATPDAGDLGALYQAQALQKKAFGDPKGALTSVDKSIQLWTEHYGPRYYLLSTGYSLHGQLEAKLNDRLAAVNDYEHSLEILRLHGDRASRIYFLIEAAYAKSLQMLGMREDAKHLEEEAKSGLSSLRNQCSGCTIRAYSIR